MAGPINSKKRKLDEGMKGRPKKLKKSFKKQTDYYSTSESESEIQGENDFQAVNLQESDDEAITTDLVTAALSDEEENDEPALDDADEEEVTDASNSDSASGEDEDDEEESGNPNLIKKRKRNDPEAFATSMTKILSSKLSTSKRSDPVLSRSQTALQASKEITDLALEKKAKRNMKEERRTALDKGRVKDVLGASAAFDAGREIDGVGMGSVQETVEMEKRLRKTAQRGVVKLFNAVRAAQVKGEEAAREARVKGVVGQGRREERVNEMSKQGFLELIAGGGGALKASGIEEA